MLIFQTSNNTPSLVVWRYDTATKIVSTINRSPHQFSRPTAALTWRETATDKLKFNGQRDNKVAVSRSHPTTCSPPPCAFTAAAVATLPPVNFIFTTPKFATAQLRVHAEWRTTFADKVRRFSQTSRQGNKFEFSNSIKPIEFSVLPPAGGERLS